MTIEESNTGTSFAANLVTVATFTLPTELIVAQGILAAQEINSFAKNELMVQTYNFMSNAVGGVQLQVAAGDFDAARQILKKGGFIVDEEFKPNSIQKYLNDPIQFKKVKAIAIIILITLGIVISIIIYSIYLSKPTIIDKLVNNTWCIDHINYKGGDYYPNTLSESSLLYIEKCEHEMKFSETGILKLPGFETTTISGYWRAIGENQISFTNINNLDDVFEGVCGLQLERHFLTLKSKTTSIYCYN